MIPSFTPEEYLSVLNDTPEGSLLQLLNSYKEIGNAGISNKKINRTNKNRIRFLTGVIEEAIEDVKASRTNLWIEGQKLKAQAAIQVQLEEEQWLTS